MEWGGWVVCWGRGTVECLLNIWNWSPGRRWDDNFGVPLAFGGLARNVC